MDIPECSGIRSKEVNNKMLMLPLEKMSLSLMVLESMFLTTRL